MMDIFFRTIVLELLDAAPQLTILLCPEQELIETDAAGLLNTFKNLGYSMGTALIGVLLIIGIFGGLTAKYNNIIAVGNNTTMNKYRAILLAT